MKKLLITAALCALAAAPAFGSVTPWVSMTTEDGDEIEMFINKPKNTDFTLFSGSLHGNSSSTEDIDAAAGTTSTTGNGQSNIKPDGGLLSLLAFTPVNKNMLDGFFASVQLEFNGRQSNKPDAGRFWIDVNGGGGVVGGQTFAFSNKLDGNVHDNGFDEPLGGLGGLITSVTMRSDSADNIFFKEIKQIDWSPCGSANGDCGITVIGHGSVPEPSTWAMGLIGFGAMAGFAAFNRRKAARYIEV
jgi:hypothetical protein